MMGPLLKVDCRLVRSDGVIAPRAKSDGLILSKGPNG